MPVVVLELPIYNRWYAVKDVHQQTHALFEMHSRNTSAAMSDLLLGKMLKLHGRSKLHLGCFLLACIHLSFLNVKITLYCATLMLLALIK